MLQPCCFKLCRSSPQRITRKIFTILNNAARLHQSSKWREFFNKNFKESDPELVLRSNFSLGNDTRWGSKLEECLDLLLFEKAILSFYENETPDKHINQILPSDFEFLGELKDIFKIIVQEINTLQSPDSAHRISLFTFSLLKIASAADFFIQEKEKEREELQKRYDQEIEENPQLHKRIAVPSHFIQFCEALKFLIIKNFIENQKECEKRMKAALLLDPGIPIDGLPEFYIEENEAIIQWISRETNGSCSQPVEQQSDTPSQPFCCSQVNTPPASINDLNTDPHSFDHFIRHTRRNFYHVNSPWKFWISQPDSPLRTFALETFGHHVSNAPLESFFSICRTIIGQDSASMSTENLEAQALISSNFDIFIEKVIEPIKLKYNI